MSHSGKVNQKVAVVLVVSVLATVGCSSINESKFAFWQKQDATPTKSPDAAQTDYAALNQQLTDMQQLAALLKEYITDLRKLQQSNQPEQLSQVAGQMVGQPGQVIVEKPSQIQLTTVAAEQLYAPRSRNFNGMKLSLELASVPVDVSNIAKSETTPTADNIESWPSSTAAGHMTLPSSDQALSRVQLPTKTLVEPVKNVAPSAPPQEPSAVFRITFPVSSAELAVSQEVEKQLLKAAAESKQILVRGYTDAEVSTVYSERIAAERAQAAYQFLLKHGITADKVVISSSSAKDFYRDNNSEEGREQNRRVEIVMSDTAPVVVQNKPESKGWSAKLGGLLGLKF